MEKITFLGLNHSYISIISEIAEELLQIKKFEIIKNLPETTGEDQLRNRFYEYKIQFFSEVNDLSYDNRKFVFGVSRSFIKPKLYDFFYQNFQITKEHYISLIQPSGFKSKTCEIDFGVLIEPLVSISSFTKIGFGVTIKRSSTIGHHCNIGSFVTINPGVTIAGEVTIGKGTTIGAGATILNNIDIGNNCTIGAGSVVTKDIPSGWIAYGVPCKAIRKA